MAKDRIISAQEAADIRGVSREAICKAISTGRLDCVRLSAKGVLLSERQVRGEAYDKLQFLRECRRYVSVPDACQITRKTDAAVLRDLKSGKIKGFRLNGKSWAVLKSSAEDEFAEYLETHATRPGRKRDLTNSRSPRDIRKKR